MSDPLALSNDGQHNGNIPMLLKKKPAEEMTVGPATKKIILTYVSQLVLAFNKILFIILIKEVSLKT